MWRKTFFWRCSILALVFANPGSFVLGQGKGTVEHWVATWTASPQQPRPPAPARNPQAAPPAPAGFNNQTVRMIVHTSIGGRRLRVQLSNAFGTAPLAVGAAHVALHGKDSAVAPGSDRALSFHGKPSCTIPPGALILSDPVDFNVPQLGDLAVSIYVAGEAAQPTMHALGLHTAYISKQGDAAGSPLMTDATVSQSLYWLASVDVLAPAETAALVAFGDSITDGARSTPEANHSWPSVLAERLLAGAGTAKIAVLNEGIAGNRLLSDGAGVSALARFDRDVLAQAGVQWVVIMEGINDIGFSTGLSTATQPVSAEDLIAALEQMAERAHTHGIKVIGATMTSYGGASAFYSYTEKGDAIREAVNRWIRTAKDLDGVADFDAVVRDPNQPNRLRSELDSGDHLHPNDAGYRAMAESVNLSLLTGRQVSSAR